VVLCETPCSVEENSTPRLCYYRVAWLRWFWVGMEVLISDCRHIRSYKSSGPHRDRLYQQAHATRSCNTFVFGLISFHPLAASILAINADAIASRHPKLIFATPRNTIITDPSTTKGPDHLLRCWNGYSLLPTSPALSTPCRTSCLSRDRLSRHDQEEDSRN
jgi:hypothetical protein